jgi:hypothetical protein
MFLQRNHFSGKYPNEMGIILKPPINPSKTFKETIGFLQESDPFSSRKYFPKNGSY